MSYHTTSMTIFRRVCAVAGVILVAMVSVFASSPPAARADTSAAGPSSAQRPNDDECGWFYGYYYDEDDDLRFGWYWSCEDDD